MDSQAWGQQEFMGAAVEDQRQARSLARMGACLLEHPELAFSSACGVALRKAAWRIFYSSVCTTNSTTPPRSVP